MSIEGLIRALERQVNNLRAQNIELLETLEQVMHWCDDSPDFDDEPCLIKAREILAKYK